MSPEVTYLLKLRANINLEADLLLAAREIAHLLGEVEPIADIPAFASQWQDGVMARVPGLAIGLRPAGIQGYLVRAPLDRLPGALRRLTFVQQVYAVVPPHGHGVARQIATDHPSIVRIWEHGPCAVIGGVPHQTMLEVAGLVAARAGGFEAIPKTIDRILEQLLPPCSIEGGEPIDPLLAARSTSYLTHRYHIYKARFFPRLVRSLINLSMAPDVPHGSLVLLDPFVGSGTAIVEAGMLGLPAVGIDIDPLAVLITRAKLSALHMDSGTATRAADTIGALLAPVMAGAGSSNVQNGIDQAPAIAIPPWLSRKLSPAQAREITEDVVVVRSLLAQYRGHPMADLFRVALSDALARKLRFRFLGTGVGRFALNVSRPRVISLFAANVTYIARSLVAWQHIRQRLSLPPPAPAWVIQADARALPVATGCFDLLVTSPPYLPACASGRESYARSRAMAFLALDLLGVGDVDALDHSLMGSMAGDGVAMPDVLDPAARDLVTWLAGDELRRIKAAPTARYFHDLSLSLGEIRRVLREGGRCALVVAREHQFYEFATRRTLYRARMADIVAREAARTGLAPEVQIDVELIKENANARPRSLDRYHESVIFCRHGPQNAITQ